MKKKKREKMTHSFGLYLFSILTALFVVCLLTAISIFYIPIKPFRQVRDLYIGTAMTTYTHQWLATLFFSEDTINEVMQKEVAPDFTQNTIKIDKYENKVNKIQTFNISGDRKSVV